MAHPLQPARHDWMDCEGSGPLQSVVSVVRVSRQVQRLWPDPPGPLVERSGTAWADPGWPGSSSGRLLGRCGFPLPTRDPEDGATSLSALELQACRRPSRHEVQRQQDVPSTPAGCARVGPAYPHPLSQELDQQKGVTSKPDYPISEKRCPSCKERAISYGSWVVAGDHGSPLDWPLLA